MSGQLRLSDEYRLLAAAAAAGSGEAASELDPGALGRIDWQQVLGLARHHRLDGLLARFLRRTGLPAPSEIGESLRGFRQRAAAADLRARVELGGIASALIAEGVTPVALKGASLTESAYGEPGLRPFGDLDLLIAPQELAAALGALTELGYRPQHGPPARAGLPQTDPHHHPVLRSPGRAFPVELHHRATLSGHVDTAALISRAVPSSKGPHLLPNPSDHLIVLAAHFITDRQIGSLAALGQLADLARTAEQVDWGAVSERAASWGLGWEVYISLDAVRELSLASLPAQEVLKLRPSRWNPGLTRALIAHRVVPRSPVSLTPRRLSPGVRRSLLPEPAYLRSRYGSPSAPVPMLYLRHLRGLRGRLAPMVSRVLRHPRDAVGEIVLARRLRGR